MMPAGIAWLRPPPNPIDTPTRISHNMTMPSSNFPRPTRRSLLAGAAAGFVAGVAGTTRPLLAGQPTTRRTPGDGFCFLHLTDMHVARRRDGHLGWLKCVEEVNALDPRPEMVLMGGDMAFDGLYNEREEFEDQIQLFQAGADKLAMPWHPCIGNHDLLGLNSRRKVPADDPEIGAKLIMDRLGIERDYYSFDHNGWHFVVLNTQQQVETDSGPSYVPRIGPEQLEWLRFDLGAAGGKPTVVVMHIALFCHKAQIAGDPDAKAINHMVVDDGKALREILERHGVKAVLQGHSHMIEDYRYNDIWYVTSPAVSGAWWSGDWNGFAPGYTVFHAGRNGELTWERNRIDWEARLEEADTLERQRTREREAFLTEQEILRRAEIEGGM